MSSVHCIVVWEFERGGQWVPHSPGVTRTLERAHHKQLTRVVLADAEPALQGHHVNLRTLTQCRDTPDGGTVECLVRRSCYSVQSVGARGAAWEWAPFTAPPLPAELRYEPMPMEMQAAVEEAWVCGRDVVVCGAWAVQPARGAARCGPALRLVRRAPQPPYPRARPPPPAPAPPRRAPPAPPAAPAPPAPRAPVRSAPARSASPRDRKPGLARQILHNLNIFGPTGGSRGSPQEEARGTDTESGSTRRHSVDTVSTYLSHESKDSLQRGSTSELLDCSGGSDDVFEAAEPGLPLPGAAAPDSSSSDDDEDELLGGLGAWVEAVSCPQWGAVCPVCVAPLAGRGVRRLLRCQHMVHAACLRRALRRAPRPASLACGVCGEQYEAPAPPPPPAAPPLPPPRQPPGSMAWRLRPGTLPFSDAPATILVTFNFQSGVQQAGDPAPGARYYAVGFPRAAVLPASGAGRRVLALLRACWERGVLFRVRASRTTGREHVVAWATGAPPAAPHHYTHADVLRHARDRLAALLHTHTHDRT